MATSIVLTSQPAGAMTRLALTGFQTTDSIMQLGTYRKGFRTGFRNRADRAGVTTAVILVPIVAAAVVLTAVAGSSDIAQAQSATTGQHHAGTASVAPIVGSWRSDVPLPSGVVQTFRFAGDGTFDLISAVAVDGSYRVEGNRLIETVGLPGTATVSTDTNSVILSGDSLVVESGSAAERKTLRRPAGRPAGRPVVGKGVTGEWVIMLASGLAASYRFDDSGGMHIRAQVSDERGSYTLDGNTLRLTSDRSFRIPASSSFSVTGDVLTLTPSGGRGARSFHRVAD